jgi:hypothetical protein
VGGEIGIFLVNVELVHGHVWTGGDDNTEGEGEGVVSESRSEEESDYDSEVGGLQWITAVEMKKIRKKEQRTEETPRTMSTFHCMRFDGVHTLFWAHHHQVRR